MTPAKVSTGILIAVAIGFALYEASQVHQVQASLADTARESSRLDRQVRDLTRRVAEAEEHRAAAAERTAAAAPTPADHPAAPATVAPKPPEAPVPGITTKAPAGWGKNGSKPDAYVVGVDQTQLHDGMPSAYVKSVADASGGFGGMMQSIAAADYAGKRVRYSAWVKSEDANDDGAHLWFRVDGASGAQLGFDNMAARPIKGTTDWQEVSVVLDVPPESRGLAYGMFVSGNGAMWVSGARFEEVGSDVPSTNMLGQRPPAPTTPQNLSFQ
jgi:hypothetical protein